MVNFTQVHARQVLDSRGNPTVECELTLEDGSTGRAIVPSGASTGEHEAHELRDGGAAWHGKGVTSAVTNINTEISATLEGSEAEQESVDRELIELDGTASKSRLGANAVLAVSMALARALAEHNVRPLWQELTSEYWDESLPVPTLNVLNGGEHADNSVDVQEFMIAPAGVETFARALRAGSEIYHELKHLLHEQGYRTNVGDEGGFAPELGSGEEALDLLMRSIERAGYIPGEQVALCIDAAASEFYREGEYHLSGEGSTLSSEGLIGRWKSWTGEYPLASVEDGLDEDDWDGWVRLTEVLGEDVLLVGDDLFATNPERLERGIELGAANSVLIKLNQIGTVTETLETVQKAFENGYGAVISHRSGETEDVFIAHLAVATGCGLIKSGAPARSERVAKYNELLRIEEEAPELSFGGMDAFPQHS